MPFISSYLIAEAKTSSTIVNKREESRHPCLVPNLKGNACSFCPLSMYDAGSRFVIYGLYYV